MAITRHEHKKFVFHAKSVGNKRKQTEDRNTFVIYNIVSIVSSPSKRTDQNKVHAIKDLLQVIMSSTYRRKKKVSTKLGNLIAQVYNTEVKWYIKP